MQDEGFLHRSKLPSVTLGKFSAVFFARRPEGCLNPTSMAYQSLSCAIQLC